MGNRMDGFHRYFRMEYKAIYELASRYEEEGMSLREFLQTARGFHSRMSTLAALVDGKLIPPGADLNMHHQIEEIHIFPILGKRMPEFAKSTGNHLKQRERALLYVRDGSAAEI